MNLFLLHIFHLRRAGQYQAECKAPAESEKQSVHFNPLPYAGFTENISRQHVLNIS